MQINWVALFAYGITFSALGFAFFRFYRGVVTKEWPVVEGRVLDEIIESKGSGKNRDSYRTTSYAFEFKGEEFQATDKRKVEFGLIGVLREKTRPEGEMLNVSVNPQNPEDSTLYPGVTIRHIAEIVISAGFFVALAGGFIPL